MTRFRTTLLLAALASLFVALGATLGGPRGALLALIVAAGMNLLTYWNADRIVLSLHKAREVDARRCPELTGHVHRLAVRAGLPPPRVYVIDSPHPNAFATGRDPHHAAVAVTTGLLGLLDRDEIEGVIAHELGHIANRDTLVMTMTATIAGAISMLASFGSRSRNGNVVAMLLAVLVAPFAALLVQLAISRTREYGADRLGAAICGKPQALASALAKLSRAAMAQPSPVLGRNPAASALYIVPGGRSLFSTHPSTEDRIAALAAFAREMAVRAQPRASALDPLGRRR